MALYHERGGAHNVTSAKKAGTWRLKITHSSVTSMSLFFTK
jgi:hypothetical protein